MNILCISINIPSKDKKGYQIVSFHRLRYLAFKGHKIELVCFGNNNNNNDRLASKELLKIGINVHLIKYNKFQALINFFFKLFDKNIPIQCAIYSSPKFKSKIEEIIQKNVIDAIYSVMIRPILNIKFNSVPVYVDLVDSMVINFERRYKSSKGLMKIPLFEEYKRLKIFEAKVIEASKSSFFVSSLDCKNYRKYFKEKINVIPLGVNTKCKTALNYKERKYDLSFTGNMSYQPNIDAILWFYENCWQNICEIFPGISLVIAGRDPIDKIKKLNILDKNIVVTGSVKSINEILINSRISIAPMISGSGMQFKILEAMASEVPVVSTILGLGDLKAVPNQDILLANNYEQFINQILFLLSNPIEGQNIGIKGRAFVLKNHSYNKLNEKFENVISRDYKILFRDQVSS